MGAIRAARSRTSTAGATQRHLGRGHRRLGDGRLAGRLSSSVSRGSRRLGDAVVGRGVLLGRVQQCDPQLAGRGADLAGDGVDGVVPGRPAVSSQTISTSAAASAPPSALALPPPGVGARDASRSVRSRTVSSASDGPEGDTGLLIGSRLGQACGCPAGPRGRGDAAPTGRLIGNRGPRRRRPGRRRTSAARRASKTSSVLARIDLHHHRQAGRAARRVGGALVTDGADRVTCRSRSANRTRAGSARRASQATEAATGVMETSAMWHNTNKCSSCQEVGPRTADPVPRGGRARVIALSPNLSRTASVASARRWTRGPSSNRVSCWAFASEMPVIPMSRTARPARASCPAADGRHRG